MVKFTHISNYFDLMGFTIFKCGSGYFLKPQIIGSQLFGVFILGKIWALFI